MRRLIWTAALLAVSLAMTGCLGLFNLDLTNPATGKPGPSWEVEPRIPLVKGRRVELGKELAQAAGLEDDVLELSVPLGAQEIRLSAVSLDDVAISEELELGSVELHSLFNAHANLDLGLPGWEDGITVDFEFVEAPFESITFAADKSSVMEFRFKHFEDMEVEEIAAELLADGGPLRSGSWTGQLRMHDEALIAIDLAGKTLPHDFELEVAVRLAEDSSPGTLHMQLEMQTAHLVAAENIQRHLHAQIDLEVAAEFGDDLPGIDEAEFEAGQLHVDVKLPEGLKDLQFFLESVSLDGSDLPALGGGYFDLSGRSIASGGDTRIKAQISGQDISFDFTEKAVVELALTDLEARAAKGDLSELGEIELPDDRFDLPQIGDDDSIPFTDARLDLELRNQMDVGFTLKNFRLEGLDDAGDEIKTIYIDGGDVVVGAGSEASVSFTDFKEWLDARPASGRFAGSILLGDGRFASDASVELDPYLAVPLSFEVDPGDVLTLASPSFELDMTEEARDSLRRILGWAALFLEIEHNFELPIRARVSLSNHEDRNEETLVDAEWLFFGESPTRAEIGLTSEMVAAIADGASWIHLTIEIPNDENGEPLTVKVTSSDEMTVSAWIEAEVLINQ